MILKNGHPCKLETNSARERQREHQSFKFSQKLSLIDTTLHAGIKIQFFQVSCKLFWSFHITHYFHEYINGASANLIKISHTSWVQLIFEFLQPMNLVDFLAVLPYFISLCLESLQDLHILGKAGKMMRLVRVMRIMRIFKLVRHFAGLQSLLYTLKQVRTYFCTANHWHWREPWFQAYKELGLLVILVGVAVLTFSSLVFYAEKDSSDFKWTFIDSFWWGLMTLTTGNYVIKRHLYA